MAPSKTESALRDWRRAEARYAEALEEFLSTSDKVKTTKKAAIRLSHLRAEATRAMDAYLKSAVR